MTEFLGNLANFLSKQGKRITYDATEEVHPNPTLTREGVLLTLSILYNFAGTVLRSVEN